MPRVALELGENSIDRARIAKDENGSLSMQWFVRLPNGRLVRRTTRGKCSKGELRRRAHAKADELIASGGQSGVWKSSSAMSDYILREVIPSVESADDSVLRPRTRKSYLRVLTLAANALKGFRIADAIRPRALEEALVGIALSSGTATARQCAKTMSKYVLEPLVRDEVIAHNPLKSFKPRLPEHRGTNKATGGQALTPDERERVISYLLAVDPDKVEPPRRGRYTIEDRRNLRRAVVEITLLQAVTGLRINEARLLTLADMGDEGGFTYRDRDGGDFQNASRAHHSHHGYESCRAGAPSHGGDGRRLGCAVVPSSRRTQQRMGSEQRRACHQEAVLRAGG